MARCLGDDLRSMQKRDAKTHRRPKVNIRRDDNIIQHLWYVGAETALALPLRTPLFAFFFYGFTGIPGLLSGL
jgi:hypothetical protein